MPRPSHTYGRNTARHYDSYRPNLHGRIVSEALKGYAFETALDVGCGTGRSTEALTNVARNVIGVDNSAAMLSQAKTREGVEYRIGEAQHLPVTPGTIELVSLAGVLPYLDLSAFAGELRRVCVPDAIVLPYDFHVDLGPLAALFPFAFDEASSGYDHALNLSGHAAFETLAVKSEHVPLTLTAAEASHLLLSSETRCDHFAVLYSVKDPHHVLAASIAERCSKIELTAQTWFALHRLRLRF